MKGYTIEKVIETFLSQKRLDDMQDFATIKVAKKVKVTKDPWAKCYSQDSYRTNETSIVLGSKFYIEAFEKVPKRISPVDVKERYKHVAFSYYGTFYHELFHLLYTAFGAVQDLVLGCYYPFQEFACSIANILEDITIEKTGSFWFPVSKKFLDTLSTCFGQANSLALLERAIQEEPKNPSTFMAYLLDYVRGVDLSTLPKYQLWEDNFKYIDEAVFKCIHEPVAKKRAKRQVVFAYQMSKILEGKKPDKDAANQEEPPADLKSLSQGKCTELKNGVAHKIIVDYEKILENTSYSSYSNPHTEPQDANFEEQEDPTKEMEASFDKSSGGSGSPNDFDLTSAGITMMASKAPAISIGHTHAKLDDYLDTSPYLDIILGYVHKNEPYIRQVVSQIKKMKAINNASWNHYQMTGKLDMSTIYKQGNYKIFKKMNAPKEEADIAAFVLIDNSGSMSGRKGHLAGINALIFGESLNRLHIPFNISCFTQGDNAVTICLKDFHESYDKKKSNLALLTEGLSCHELSTWCGNVDEANVKYSAECLRKMPNKDKVLIIISDGATCGNDDDLRALAQSIENEGILVLGIGIYDHNVENLYSKHIVLSKPEELEKLGQFLNKYLVSLTFKGGNK